MARKPAFVAPYKRDRESKASYEDRTDFLRRLHELLKPGDKVTMVIRHVSSSGMYRAIDFYLLGCEKGEISRSWLSYWMAHAGIGRWDERREAVGMSGAGMDMGFHAVYNLGAMLYPKGWLCTGKDCPSNAHTNGAPRPHPFPTTYAGREIDESGMCPIYRCGLLIEEHPTKAQRHADGGYALRHEWLG